MKYWDICSRKEYEKNGEKKTVWLKCGTLRETNEGKRFVELNMFPMTSFYVFEPKAKNGSAPVKQSPEDIVWSEE